MLQKLVIVASIAGVICALNPRTADALAGRLSKPGIAIPTGDSTAAAMNKVLGAYEKQFAGGHFVNAHSVLNFNGGVKTINALLDELAKIEGGALQIRFSKGPASFVTPLAAKEEQPKPCDFTVNHNGWGNAHDLTITIYLGDGVKLEDLRLPAVRGRASSREADRRELSP